MTFYSSISVKYNTFGRQAVVGAADFVMFCEAINQYLCQKDTSQVQQLEKLLRKTLKIKLKPQLCTFIFILIYLLLHFKILVINCYKIYKKLLLLISDASIMIKTN